MRKLKLKIVTAFVTLAVLLGFAVSPVTVLAEEQAVSEQTSEIVAEASDSVTAEEIPEEIKENENTQEKSEVLESETNTFENFLAWTEKEADRYGYGDEYRRAFEDIKNAATTKQVTIATVVNALLWVLGVGYIVYKKITDKKSLAKLSSIGNQAGTQLKKLNELVDATNENSNTEEKIRQETAELKAEMKKTAEALTGLINGFMHFADGVQLKNSRKDEVRRDCTNALKKIDGEVVSNENDKNNEK